MKTPPVRGFFMEIVDKKIGHFIKNVKFRVHPF